MLANFIFFIVFMFCYYLLIAGQLDSSDITLNLGIVTIAAISAVVTILVAGIFSIGVVLMLLIIIFGVLITEDLIYERKILLISFSLVAFQGLKLFNHSSGIGTTIVALMLFAGLSYGIRNKIEEGDEDNE